VGNYIELGQFQSVRSRDGIKWSKTLGKQHKDSRLQQTVNHTQIQTTKSQRTAEQVGNEIIATVKAASENAIEDANRLMQVEFPYERNA
jgi:hypothetical protein